jgi:hypothetical protein
LITENLSTLKIHRLTQDQYDRELASGNIDDSALYLTPDEEIDLSPYATIEQLNTKADSDHTHNISDVANLQGQLDALYAVIPTVTTSDNGKFLRVVNGVWAATTVPNAEGVKF